MLKNMKISSMLVVGFCVMILLSAIISVYSFFNLGTVADNTQALYEKQYMRGDSIATLRRELASVKGYLMQAIGVSDPQLKKKAIENAVAAGDQIVNGMGLLQQSYEAAGESTNIEKINAVQSKLTEARAIREKVQKEIESYNQMKASSLFFEQYQPLMEEIEGDLTAFRDLERGQAAVFVAQTGDIRRNVLFWLISIFAASVVIAILIQIVVIGSIKRPMTEVLSVTRKMAQGNLKAAFNYRSKNEFGQLADGVMTTMRTLQAYISNIAETLGKIAKGDMTVSIDMYYIGDFAQIKTSLNEITDSLNEILSQINQSSTEVLSGAGQTASAAQALSQGSTEQASSIEELSATIQDISNQIAQNAENAKSAKMIANDSSRTIENASSQMLEMIAAMERINETSKKISKIIKTIDEIAFQTNILALNAAVEAARAGEAGKGFAVVADEVRNLASKSAEAAKDTTVLIENSILAVDRGSKIADETAKSLTLIVDNAKRSADLVSLISEASILQSQAIAQTTKGVEQISFVVQTNSATAEESASASEKLSSQADMLNQLVHKFKLRSGQVSPPKESKSAASNNASTLKSADRQPLKSEVSRKDSKKGSKY